MNAYIYMTPRAYGLLGVLIILSIALIEVVR